MNGIMGFVQVVNIFSEKFSQHALRVPGSLLVGTIEKAAGDERGLVGKNERSGEPVSIVLKSSFRYTSSWYTLWLVTFDSLYQHLVCLSEAKWRLTWQAWYTRVVLSCQNSLKRSEWSKERVWSIWPVDRCFCHYSHRFREKLAFFFRHYRSDGLCCCLHVAGFAEFDTSTVCKFV